jgi:hypothetical protein
MSEVRDKERRVHRGLRADHDHSVDRAQRD